MRQIINVFGFLAFLIATAASLWCAFTTQSASDALILCFLSGIFGALLLYFMHRILSGTSRPPSGMRGNFTTRPRIILDDDDGGVDDDLSGDARGAHALSYRGDGGSSLDASNNDGGHHDHGSWGVAADEGGGADGGSE